MDLISNYNVDHAGQCVELIGYIARALPHARFEGGATIILIEALRDIDGADVLLARSTCSSSRSAQGVNIANRAMSTCCSRCQAVSDRNALKTINLSLATAQLSPNRKRSANTASFKDLHDEACSGIDDSDSERDSGIVIESVQSNADEEGPTIQRVSLTKKMRQFGNEPKVSLKRVMGSVYPSSGDSLLFSNKAECACLCFTNSGPIFNESQETKRICSALPLKMIQLRSDTYRALLSLAKFHLHENFPYNGSINAVIFAKAFRQMRKHPMCGANRLSAVLVADARGIENGFLPLLAKLLVSSVCPSGDGIQCIRIFAELLVNLAVFDDPVVFWKATKSLFDRSLEMSSYPPEYQFTVRRAISYIFVERYRIVSIIEKNELQPYITAMSELFGSQRYWTHETMLQEERDEIIYALQSLGILGFLDGDEETATPEIGECFLASLCGGSFPFIPPSSLRDAAARMGPHVGCKRFLSDARMSIDLLRSDQKEAQIKPKDRTDSIDDGTAILEHLKDNFLLRRIFSFLNHRKLAAASSVCRIWRQIASEPALWQRLYRLRFKTLVEMDVLPNPACSKVKSSYASKENDRDWRKLFDVKWSAERQLRSSYSRDGKWRHKTCSFVGCLVVLKSKASFEKHICKHKNDLAKKVEKIEASEERKRKGL